MPELPEVQTVVTTLAPHVTRQTIREVRLNRKDILRPSEFDLCAHLAGKTISSIARRGKKIVFTLDDANRFYIHLGMSGRLTAELKEAELRKHTHLIIDVGERELRFVDPRRFGGVWWLGQEESADNNLGPEPLGMRPEQLAARLARTKRAIKNALLDQRVVAGLGNIYVDESLFEAKIHPLSPADTLTIEQIRRLNRAIKSTLRRALRHRGSTLRDYRDGDGKEGAFQRLHRVYDCAGKACKTCKTPIERIVLGGRSTHFCPKCQHVPRAARP